MNSDNTGSSTHDALHPVPQLVIQGSSEQRSECKMLNIIFSALPKIDIRRINCHPIYFATLPVALNF